MTDPSGRPLIIILRMLHKDIASCASIESEVSLNPWLNDFDTEQRELDGSIALVAKIQQDRIVGYVIGRVIFDELEILQIATARQHQRQGIAMLLMHELIQESRKKHAVKAFLEVGQNNNAAIKLYEKYGFKSIYIRKKYYTNTGEDALVMSLQFN